MKGKYAIAIHGGAGNIREDQAEIYKKTLGEALAAGAAILADGGPSIDAVEAAVEKLENSPFFNAGRGSVMTHDAEFELDASIMNGINREAGAVCALRNIANPIKVARLVMDRSDHVLLSAKGARRFAEEMGFTRVPSEYFYTEERARQLQAAKKSDRVMLDHSHDEKYGTVGAVALDKSGNLAAATSTGGLTNKKWGRIGDSPIVGAGTWADNNCCAVSCTGQGEAFLRSATAYEVAARMKFGKMSLKQAADKALFETIRSLGAEGGLIAVDKTGEIAMPFISRGMYRASIREGEEAFTGIF